MLVFFEELFGYVFAGVKWCVIACISVGPIEAYHACPPDKSILVIFAKLSTLSPNLRPWPLCRESLVLHITAILPSLTDNDDDDYDALLLNLFPFPSVLQSFLSLSGDVQSLLLCLFCCAVYLFTAFGHGEFILTWIFNFEFRIFEFEFEQGDGNVVTY